MKKLKRGKLFAWLINAHVQALSHQRMHNHNKQFNNQTTTSDAYYLATNCKLSAMPGYGIALPSLFFFASVHATGKGKGFTLSIVINNVIK